MKAFSTFHSTLGALAVLALATPGLQAADPQPGGASTREAAPSRTGAPGSGQLDKSDEQFVMKAAQSGLTEVQLGEIASQKAASEPVKELGAMMVKDHTKANQELSGIVGKKGLALPTEPDSKHKAKVDKLSKLSGSEFDKEYVDAMVDSHKKGVSEFEKASKSAKDPDIKAFAAKTLPTLQGHLQHVQGLKKNGGAQKANTKTE